MSVRKHIPVRPDIRPIGLLYLAADDSRHPFVILKYVRLTYYNILSVVVLCTLLVDSELYFLS